MAKRNTQEIAADLPDSTPMGPGLVGAAMPPQHVIDQMASGPQMTPEEQAVTPRRGRPKREIQEASAGMQTMQQILDEFLDKVARHPDAKMLTSDFGGKPPQGALFTGTPLHNQHLMLLRLMWRDPQPEVQSRMEESVSSAYEPGGRYYGLIPKRGEPEIAESVPQEREPAWRNLVRQREVAAT